MNNSASRKRKRIQSLCLIIIFLIMIFYISYSGKLFPQNDANTNTAYASITEEIPEPDIRKDLLRITEGDRYLYILVDKQHPLENVYVPDDLVELVNRSYRVTREGLTLRRMAADSLETMAAAALRDGVTLTAGSAFRTYDYQAEVYERNVRQMGRQAADRESARPGHSQHQLGLAVDFFPIDDAFAETPAHSWLLENASRFGWSLSYPQGYEDITGYRWESWHYRFVGAALAEFIEKYFDGIQQNALLYINSNIEPD